ncbi:MAG: carbohydrate ABC transporter permease [Lachnospiraceae bacterium]|jgi:sn-glycerol 3-phosphate transport system permease protein|nr:carbohydrate ABC transporter permease [Lachnospiraceae bacterium]
MKERNKKLEAVFNGIDLFGKIVLIFIMAFPFFWMISTALQTLKETISVPLTIIPADPQWVNFAEVFKTINVFSYLKNSIIVCIFVVVLQYFIIVPAAYSLAKFDYKGKPLVFGLVLLGQMIPMQITFLPIYFMFSKMGWMDTYQALIIPFISNPFGIFMLRQYFMQVPSEVIEAAKLDDASEFKIMFKVMMPMVKSALVTIGLLIFISTWNNYFWPLIMTSKESFRTLPIGISLLKDADTLQRWNVIMAGNLLLVLPMLGLYVAASKKIRNAFVYSGIK